MADERWRQVTKSAPCPACGKSDWCAWTPDGLTLKCERTDEPPIGMALVKRLNGGGLFRCDGDGESGAAVPANRPRPTKPLAA